MSNVISIVGKSNSGKTTLIEKIINELSTRGYKIATIKHTFHKLNIDSPGKDTWRHINAGSKATALIASDAYAIIKPSTDSNSINEIIKIFEGKFDLIIVEGFKQSNLAKIIVKSSDDVSLISDLKNVIAIATNEPLNTAIKQFMLNDIVGISNLIENSIMTQ